MNPSPESTIQLPLASGATGTPFSRDIIHLTKQAAIQLKWEAGYWKAQHDRLLVRNAEREHELKAQLDQLLARKAELEQKLEHERAKNRDLIQRLPGKRSEKAVSRSEAQSNLNKPSRPRGHTPGAPGHGRTSRPYLAVVEELRTLPPEALTCPCCQKPYSPSGTEDSDLLEIEVRSDVRRVKRQRYRQTCQSPQVPGLVTAPARPAFDSAGHAGDFGVGGSAAAQISLRHSHEPFMRGFGKPGRTHRPGNVGGRTRIPPAPVRAFAGRVAGEASHRAVVPRR